MVRKLLCIHDPNSSDLVRIAASACLGLHPIALRNSHEAPAQIALDATWEADQGTVLSAHIVKVEANTWPPSVHTSACEVEMVDTLRSRVRQLQGDDLTVAENAIVGHML